MTAQQKITFKQQSKAFHDFLMERFDGDDSYVDQTIEVAENIIPDLLNQYFGTQYNSIYEITDVNEIEDFRRKIKADPILKNKDMMEEPRYTEVLRNYRLFVKALSSNSAPIPVSGETQPEQPATPNPSPTKSASHKTLSTVFLEGEAGETQEVTYRQRNMELRQACIDYYKTLHDGHIVCECCGFEFAKAYVIDDDYIEIHHIHPFSHTDGEHPVDAITDLIPLCANCHRMIHHGMGGRGNCMTPEELKKKLR